MGKMDGRNGPPAHLGFHTNHFFCDYNNLKIFSLRYLQNETDLPVTPPDGSMILTPNMVSTLNFSNDPKKSKQEQANVSSQLKEGKIFNIGVTEQNVHKIKLPALQKRKLQKSTCSLDNRKLVAINLLKRFNCCLLLSTGGK